MTEMEIANEVARIDTEIISVLNQQQESWERSDTDGFLSQWASGLTAFIDGRGRGLSGTAWVATRRLGNEWGADAIPEPE